MLSLPGINYLLWKGFVSESGILERSVRGSPPLNEKNVSLVL
jgi:hypothetical protein